MQQGPTGRRGLHQRSACWPARSQPGLPAAWGSCHWGRRLLRWSCRSGSTPCTTATLSGTGIMLLWDICAMRVPGLQHAAHGGEKGKACGNLRSADICIGCCHSSCQARAWPAQQVKARVGLLQQSCHQVTLHTLLHRLAADMTAKRSSSSSSSTGAVATYSSHTGHRAWCGENLTPSQQQHRKLNKRGAQAETAKKMRTVDWSSEGQTDPRMAWESAHTHLLAWPLRVPEG